MLKYFWKYCDLFSIFRNSRPLFKKLQYYNITILIIFIIENPYYKFDDDIIFYYGQCKNW